MRFLGCSVMVAVTAACNPNWGGQGSSGDQTPSTASDSTGNSGVEDATASPMTSGIMTSGGSMSVDNTSDEPATTTSEGTTSSEPTGTTDPTGEPVCPPPAGFSELVMAADATLVDPAERRAAWGGLSGMPEVAFSFVANNGLIHFDFEVPCDGTYHVWGLVWDLHRGSGFSCGSTPNADSMLMFVDEAPGSEQRWNWGCNSCGWKDQVWDWARAAEYLGNPCLDQPISYEWDAGMHRISFFNESEGLDAALPDVAAIAAVVISDDPSFDPSSLYAP